MDKAEACEICKKSFMGEIAEYEQALVEVASLTNTMTLACECIGMRYALLMVTTYESSTK
jgi:hypothetical protein